MSAFTRIDGWAFWLGEGIDYVARAALPWEVGAKGSGLRIVVPVGFVFNTSIPNLLRWIFNPHDKRYLKAAALHNDALAATGIGKMERLAMTIGVIVWRWK